MNLTEKQKTLIESYGVLLERFGLSPVAARINSLLTVIDEEALTFDQIKTQLQISKSATSTALNTLLLMNFVGFQTKLGDRKRYFYSEIKSWKDKMQRDIAYTQELVDILRDIQTNKSDVDLQQKKDVGRYADYLKDVTAYMSIRLKEKN